MFGICKLKERISKLENDVLALYIFKQNADCLDGKHANPELMPTSEYRSKPWIRCTHCHAELSELKHNKINITV